MSKNNFTRTNVDVQQMEVSAPSRSSFDLSKNDKFSLRLGRLIPLRTVNIMPNSTFKGSVNPDLQLEKFATPASGPMRLDTHSFVVPYRRVNKDYKDFQKGAINGNATTLPNFTIGDVVNSVIALYLGGNSQTEFMTSLQQVITRFRATSGSIGFNPDDVCKNALKVAYVRLENQINSTTDKYGYLQDYLGYEYQRLVDKYNTITGTGYTSPYLMGDVFYDLLFSYLGEGSVLENLGYDCMTYFGQFRNNLNKYDRNFRTATQGTGAWDQTKWNTYLALWTDDILTVKKFLSCTCVFNGTSATWTYINQPSQSEMPLRAAYACWYDWFRNYHLEKTGDVLDPDNFGASSIIANVTMSTLSSAIQLLASHARNWSRDAFTMVQPDDVYRHIYAPASCSSDYVKVSDISFAEYSAMESPFASLFTEVHEGIGTVPVSFPSWAYSSLFASSTAENFDAYYHDLQTMRRANMLEKYLQKNYFNSDTFAGQIEAHYGVKPADYSILVSQYIGGNETMIKGEQQISPVNTPTSDAGERTLIANASSNDSFAYACSDASILVNFASIVPIVSYNARNPFLHEIGIMDQPLPEWSGDSRIIIRTCDLMRDFMDSQDKMLGFVPRYYQYRHALDGVHGKYLKEYRTYDWLRDRYTQENSNISNLNVSPLTTLDAYSQHINIAPDCFLGLKPWDDIAFGSIQMPLFVECPLAGKVEFV